MNVIVEAGVVGISLLVFAKVLKMFNVTNLFVVGFLIHLVFEILGLNRWYCKYGAACSRN